MRINQILGITLQLTENTLKTKPKEVSTYVCSRCSRDKNNAKKVSIENSMIPSPVPKQLQGLTQFEEMLIA